MGTGRKPVALLVDDAAFDLHRPIGYHPERPERLLAARAAVAAVAAAGVDFTRIDPPEASTALLERVHDARFLESLEKLRGKRGMLDPDTFVSEKSIEAAKRAAGGAAEMVAGIVGGMAKTGVALLRPPGHHARPAHAMGFCLLNNVAVAAARARELGLERVAIVDYDVHHGNGTEEIFYRDPHVLYVSLHQFPFYPGTGSLEATGEGEGRGFTLNVPLASGGGDAVYRAAFDRIVSPALEAYAPELVLVSAGFDASARDPLAEMQVSPRGYGYMTQRLVEQAQRSAGGRIALVLEGGYDLPSLESGLGEAMAAVFEGRTYDDLPSDTGSADVERAARAAEAFWKLS